MWKKIYPITIAVLVVAIIILCFVIDRKNLRIENQDLKILRLEEDKDILSFEFKKLDLRRIRRDSLAETQNKVYDDQISKLDAANDSSIKRVTLGLIAE